MQHVIYARLRRVVREWLTALALLVLFGVPAGAAPEGLQHSTDQAGPMPTRTLLLRGAVYHVQGLAMDADFIYVTSLNKKTRRGYVHKFTRSGDLVQVADVTDGSRDHPGGISLDGDTLWVPVAESHASSSARIMQLDKRTLAPISSFTVQDHIGAVAVQGDRLFGANWSTKSFYVWDRAGTLIEKPTSPTQVHYQDMKVIGGELVASGLMPDDKTGAVDWLDPVTFAPRQRIAFGKSPKGQPWTQEGMNLEGSTLYLLPIDGGKDGVEIYAFDLAAVSLARTRLRNHRRQSLCVR